jgi:hypothetical protein
MGKRTIGCNKWDSNVGFQLRFSWRERLLGLPADCKFGSSPSSLPPCPAAGEQTDLLVPPSPPLHCAFSPMEAVATVLSAIEEVTNGSAISQKKALFSLSSALLVESHGTRLVCPRPSSPLLSSIVLCSALVAHRLLLYLISSPFDHARTHTHTHTESQPVCCLTMRAPCTDSSRSARRSASAAPTRRHGL